MGASFFHETRVTTGAHNREPSTTDDKSASGDQLAPEAPRDSAADLARGMGSDLTAERTPGADSTFTLQRLADLPTKR